MLIFFAGLSSRLGELTKAPRTAKSFLFVVLALAFFGSSIPTFAAEPVLVDRILAIVDEEVILQSDLNYEVEAFRLEKQYAGEPIPEDSPEIRQEVLDRLIETKLVIAAAKQADMDVDEEAVESSVSQRIEQYDQRFGSREAFERELIKSGTTLSDFRVRMATQLRDQQYLRLVMGRFIRPQVEVMENEVREYYLEHLAEMPSEPDSLTIANILIPVQPSMEVRRGIQEVVAQVNEAVAAGRPFAAIASEFSKGPNASRGGTVGVVAPGDLFDPNLDRTVFSLTEGQISEPVISSRGVHILSLDNIAEDGRRAISQVFLPMEVTQEDVDQANGQIVSARDRIVAGEAFSLVAGEVSGDPMSAANGGLLGTFRLEDLSSQFQEVLVEAQKGDLTEPLLTPAGWYVFKIIDRVAGHMYTFEELRENLRQFVEGEKMQSKLELYVAELRERFFVDIKN